MKEVKVRFRRNSELDYIDVTIQASERDATVRKLMEEISGKPPDHLNILSTDGKMLNIFMDDIISVSVRDKVTLLQTEVGMFSVRQPLQSLEATLDSEKFLRISRHELINIDKIQRVDLKVRRELKLELTGGIETWASHRCIPTVLRRLQMKEEV